MKTSAPVSTLRYHSGASWAAFIQHLGSIPKAVQYAIVVHARDAAGVVEEALHHSSLNALTVSSEEDLEV